MLEKIKETAAFIKNIIQDTPDYAIVLGSGLGKLQDEVQPIHVLEYPEIPNFPQTTVVGHGGKLIYGILEGKKVLMMSGRFHYYEGYSMETVTFPFKVFHLMGIKNLLLSNASGGVNPNFEVGDIMIVKDHINMMPEHPLRGHNDERFGPRFVNMSEPYSKAMIEKAFELSEDLNIYLKTGIYLCLQGPTFETLAEYKMVKALGADCVGMSTVPEVIVARHMNMECFGVSVITDMGDEENIEEVNHVEVLQAAQKAEPHVRNLIKNLIAQY